MKEKFSVQDFRKPETEIEKWILGDVIEALNLMREQQVAHQAAGEFVEAEKYVRGIRRMMSLAGE